MSYSTQAKMARDNYLLERVTACAATQGIENPADWAYRHQWKLSAEPGWDEAYSYALAGEEPNPTPGDDGSVISDGMILASVQKFISEQT